eukprot:TRINITY_DN4604_c0_g1_i1.p1 TRINITY_DN4604_c0_g1~~TRINITY_DN4604_c0_g1_i1.p1  ORF type:complete len:431 (-),score=140.28 TRINITY_DN4604_c0_g1_i1:22-1314(-)
MEKEPINKEEGDEEETVTPFVKGEVNFQSWPSIVLFHNIAGSVKKLPAIEAEIGRPLYPLHSALEHPIHYSAKIKLHGMNAAITIENIALDGEQPKFALKVQSRTQFISPTSGLAGIITKTKGLEQYFLNLPNPEHSTSSKILQSYRDNATPIQKLTFFGEWAGPGVQSGVALSRIPHPAFFLFSVQIDDLILFDPLQISDILTSDLSQLSSNLISTFKDNFHIIPWFNFTLSNVESKPNSFEFNFADSDSLDAPINIINTVVDQIDKEDPYILSLFKVKGPGEGLVWFPTSQFLLTKKPFNFQEEILNYGISRMNFSKYCFKTKGEKHRVVATKKAVAKEPEKVEGAKEYAQLMVTEVRCEQGLKEGGFELKKENVGKFLNWVVNDVKKEGQDELKASGLDWKVASKSVGEAARGWFLKKVEEKSKGSG